MGLSSLLTGATAFGLTRGQRRWLGVGMAAAMLFSYQAIFFSFTKVLTWPEGPERELWLDSLAAAVVAFGASVVALPCAVAWERGRGGVLAPLGVALALAGLAWAFAGTAEPPLGMRGLEFRVGWAWAAVALGAPAACASLIALMRLDGGRLFLQVAVIALATIVFGALLLGLESTYAGTVLMAALMAWLFGTAAIVGLGLLVYVRGGARTEGGP